MANVCNFDPLTLSFAEFNPSVAIPGQTAHTSAKFVEHRAIDLGAEEMY
jgi:hypothetical protein